MKMQKENKNIVMKKVGITRKHTQIKNIHTAEPKRITVLEEAQTLVYGDRAASYGSVTDNFTNIARGWSVIMKTEVTPEMVGLCMAWMKISRQVFKPSHDNLVDCAGYIACIDKMKSEI